MNKKIFTLLLLVFVLISISAVSSADLNDTDSTLAVSDSSDITAAPANNNSDALEISENQDTLQVPNSDDMLGAEIIIAVAWEKPNPVMNQGESNPTYIVFSDESKTVLISGVPVKLTIDKDYRTTTDSNGIATFDLSEVAPGNYTGRYYVESSDYTWDYSGYTFPLIVKDKSKTPTNITVENTTVNLFILDSVATGATLTPADAGNLTFTSSNSSVAKVENGTIIAVGEGTAVITVSFAGNENYSAAENKTITVTVTLKDASVSVNNSTLDLFVDDTFDLNASTVPKGLNVTYVVDNSGVVEVSSDGVVTALKEGTASIIVKVGGDGVYAENSTTVTVTVNSVSKDSTKITVANVVATYKVNKYLVITLKDSKGNVLANSPVTVDLNGAKKYTTDENGQVKVKVSNMVPKTYTAKITFAGNDNYLGCDATAKVVVKKATPKITATNIMFKTTTKTKKYTTTLKDNAGNVIKNAKVYLKVNGKTYKATTNSKGKATFKITKLNKKGSFKATVTYKGSKYYNKVTKKVSIKVISTWKTISKGSKLKSTVKKIQRALKSNGYYLTASGHYIKVDGIYGDYTVKAVKQFQKAKGLKVTGKVDENTAKKLGII